MSDVWLEILCRHSWDLCTGESISVLNIKVKVSVVVRRYTREMSSERIRRTHLLEIYNN